MKVGDRVSHVGGNNGTGQVVREIKSPTGTQLFEVLWDSNKLVLHDKKELGSVSRQAAKKVSEKRPRRRKERA